MQQRGINTSMDVESEGEVTPPQSRGRNNSKLKVLVRSHAMREETSPPREPPPTAALNSPFIKLTLSTDSHPPSPIQPVLVLSPSVSRGNSPSFTPNLSPTTTLVPSPTRYSPQNHSSPEHKLQTEFTDIEHSPKVNKLNRQNLERLNGRNIQKTDIIVEETSHSRKGKCECTNTCNSCLRNQERNYNNNLSSSNNNNMGSANTLTVSRVTLRGKFRHQSSSQGSFEGSSSNSPCLSRDNSSEQYTDTTGVDLELFIPETLNRNAKDRALMLRIEEELVHLAKDKGKTHFKFPPMSSYQRMLVHRCAAYFGMDHNIESSGKCVVVNKTKNTRIPDVEFKQHVKEDIVFSEEPRRSILKRDSNSIEDYNYKSPDRQCGMENRRSKSFEEREEEYERARRRIFNKEMHDCGSTDDLAWSEMWLNADTENIARYRLHNSEHHSTRCPGRLLKVQSEDPGEETLRPCVAKSYSFGGYGGVLSRGDSVMSTHSAGPRLLTKQDSGASSVSWRLSPSSSGYKTQSQRSESVTPSPTSTPYLSGDSTRQDSTNSTATNTSDMMVQNSEDIEGTQVVWAVTNINSVPKGSIIINPQTGQPVKNEDGSLYHYDPENPLPDLRSPTPTAAKPPPSPVKSPQKSLRERPQSPKKRSRASPIKKTNSSTSPSLPYTPPPPPPPRDVSRTYSFAPSADSNPQPQLTPQQYPMYTPSYTPDNNVPIYPQPCIVFAPYAAPTPVQFDARIDTQVQEVPSYYGLTDSNAPTQPITYQAAAPPVWNQQSLAYYQNNPPPPNPTPRFAVPIPQQGSYMTPYPSYLPSQNIPSNPQSQEILPMYQPSMMYQPSQTSVYPNQNLMYTQHNPSFSNQTVYQPHNISYPTNPPTPNSSNYQIFEQGLVQNMSQMALSERNKMVENRVGTPKRKFSGKNGMCSSSQSSTETSSPAMTVVAGYCHNNQGLYRTTTETPPIAHNSAGYGNNYPPVLFRQMSNVRASTPVTSRGSRSPTPSETHIDRQRYSLPPLVHYQGMPYPIQSDTRLVPGRGQPTAYRQAPSRQHSVNSADKSYKNRRSRGNKPPIHLPPNGKQQPH